MSNIIKSMSPLATIPFRVHSDMIPRGDQPEAIKQIVDGIGRGYRGQTLLGVTGSGKTFAMAKVIEQCQRPTLVMAPNKTLAGQLCAEFMALFPDNAVEYFVSYYDYYQPEAYIPSSDTYIEKESMINDEIDRLRHSATASLLSRRDVIVVASVSCIYGIGNPEDYRNLMLSVRPGMVLDRDEFIRKLVDIHFERNDYEKKRGTFSVKGDVIDVVPTSANQSYLRIEFFGDEIERVSEIDRVTGKTLNQRKYEAIFPASLYATTDTKMKSAVTAISVELDQRLAELHNQGKLLEAYRLEQKTRQDLDLLLETGSCKGIENYSRHLDGRAVGVPAHSLIDFFPEDYLLMMDESHVGVPQVGGMYNGDRARKESLVAYGFRLPSALDNRPLNFSEFEERMGQTLFVSATPGAYEKKHSQRTVEQVIRPTGLVDPPIAIRPVNDEMIADIISEIKRVIKQGERALVMTITKKQAEDLADHFKNEGIKVAYLHSDIKTAERMVILRQLRQGVVDVLVGINLLREGIDLPEVSYIAILDADQAGFLRSETSLIQIIGRAARNVNSLVVLYANDVTDAMSRAIGETSRRRELQLAHNEANGIIPATVQKEVRELINTAVLEVAEDVTEYGVKNSGVVDQETYNEMTNAQLERLAKRLEKEMQVASKRMAFEEACELRDHMMQVRSVLMIRKTEQQT